MPASVDVDSKEKIVSRSYDRDSVEIGRDLSAVGRKLMLTSHGYESLLELSKQVANLSERLTLLVVLANNMERRGK